MSNFPSVDSASSNRTAKEWRNTSAFAALTTKGQIQSWGNPSTGGIVPAEIAKATGVKQIYSTQRAFAALTDTGEVLTWGDSDYGGDSSTVKNQLKNIRKISSTAEAFAAISKSGKVITWGSTKHGGNSSGASEYLQSGVVDVFSTDGAFAAQKDDDSVIIWGDEFSGGSRGIGTAEIAFHNAKSIHTTTGAFAAFLKNNTVATRGYWNNGGAPEGMAVAALQSGQVKDIFSNDFTFVALMKDGTVVPWGSPSSGGNVDSVESKLQDIVDIVGNRNAYAALNGKGGVVSWGISGNNYTDVSDQLISGVESITASDQAFAALKMNGAVVTWGSPTYGADSSAVTDQIQSGVVELAATEGAFAARKEDGSVITWGSNKQGGNSSAVQEELQSGVTKLFTTDSAFAALKNNGSIVAWGSQSSGGDSKYISGNPGKVKTLANVFTNDFIGKKFKTTPDCHDITKVSLNPVLLIDSPKKGKDRITGTLFQDLIGNGPGPDILTGKGGPDIFWFNTFEKFGRKSADKIKDYDPSNDVLIFGKGRFRSMPAEPSICFAKSRKELKLAMKSDSDFIYNKATGQLLFNENGERGGFGKGGLFAILIGRPVLNELGIGFTQ